MFVSAKADMKEESKKIGSDVAGFLLPNGDFIFSVYDEGLKKMVRVTNVGTKIESGNLHNLDVDWTNDTTWKKDDADYNIINFKGKRGMS